MTYEDVLNFCEEQDVRFIRLSYFDMYGTQKNVSVLPTELKRAFVEGISFDASAIDGFLDEVHSDLFLYPDPNTMRMEVSFVCIVILNIRMGRLLKGMCVIY